MQTEFILTKVRPIKKMFIIEDKDYDSFAKVFIELQDEIDIIQNLIFIHDSDLFSKTNKDFIRRSDPDIILNLSTLNDDELAAEFGIFSVRPVTDQFKIARFGTNLYSFTRWPVTIENIRHLNDFKFEAVGVEKLDNSSESLMMCINYGMFPENLKESIRLSIFREIQTTVLSGVAAFFKDLFEQHVKYIQLTTQIGAVGGSGYGWSRQEVDYNNKGVFDNEKKYFFVSEKNDFKTICFFWNTRSYYTQANIPWLPVDLLSELLSFTGKDCVYVCINDTIANAITALAPGASIFRMDRLYFRGRNERWTIFDHTQTLNVSGNELIVQHPSQKSFSDSGIFGSCMLEIRGLKEFAYPVRQGIGDLFYPGGVDEAMPFSDQFIKISSLGLSKVITGVMLFKNEDIVEAITLPSFITVMECLFDKQQYVIKKTAKSSILEQTVNLLGGLKELELLSGRYVFDLLVSLTPNVRTERIVNRLFRNASEKLSADNMLEVIGEIRDKGAIVFPSVTQTAEDMIAKTAAKDVEKKGLMTILQKLYDRKILLRGKYFECPHCNSNLWLGIDQIKRINYCVDCNNEIRLPVFNGDKQESDYYRLNQLMIRCIDQGQLSTLLLLNLFFKQRYRAFEYLSNLEVSKEGKVVTDIDLLIKIGKKIGIAECKSTGGFSETQVDELLKTADLIQCDFIAFSTVTERDSEVVKMLVETLNKKSLIIPAFVFSKETLLQPKWNLVHPYFEIGSSEKPWTGAVLL